MDKFNMFFKKYKVINNDSDTPEKSISKILLQKYWPCLCFFLVTVFMFRDFIFSNELLFGSDTIASGIFFRKFYADFVRKFWEMPMWDNYILSGIPFVDATHGDTFYPTSILKFFMPLHKALGYKLVIHIFLAGVFMYGFLKEFKIHKYAAFLGGLAYMLAPMIVSLVHPGHDAKIYVAALLPLAFKYLYKALVKARNVNFIYLGGVVGLMILSSHVQTTYFALWLIFFYALFIWISDYLKTRDFKPVLKSFSLFWIAMIFAIIIGAVQLIPPYIYAKKFSIRGTESKTSFEHAISWGLHPEEAFSLLVPEFCGDGNSNSGFVDQIKEQIGNNPEKVKQVYQQYVEQQRMIQNNTYWGRNAFKLNSEYSGIVMSILALSGLILGINRRYRETTFFGLMAILFLLYALVNHTPLFYLFYKLVPGVNLFRGQSMIMFLFTFAITVSGTLLLDEILTQEKKELLERLRRCGSRKYILCGIIFLLFIPVLLPDIFISIFNAPSFPDSFYKGSIQTGALINLLISAGLLILIYLFLQGKIKLIHLVITFALVIGFDTYKVNNQYIKTVTIESLGTKFRSDRQIDQIKREMEKEGLFRVFNINQYQNTDLNINGLESIDGFHDNELKWHRLYKGVNEQGVVTNSNLMQGIGSEHMPFLSIAGVKYILYRDQKTGKAQTFPNPDYLPRAKIMSNYEIITDENKIVERIADKNFDYKNSVILEEKPENDYNLSSYADTLENKGKVVSYNYNGNKAILEVSMEKPGLVFINENYFPYWSAHLENGEEIDIYKADLTYRAIFLDKGNHKVTFTYKSLPYIWGRNLSLLGILAIFGSVILIRIKKTAK